MKAIVILTEAVLVLVLAVGIEREAQKFFVELKKETFKTMKEFMSISFEDYTLKMTGAKSEFAVTDEEYNRQK